LLFNRLLVLAESCTFPNVAQVAQENPCLLRLTSFAIEEDGKVIAFLAGFVSETYADDAYIHFVAVHPDYRGRGLGRRLYSFFETVGRL